LLAAGTLMFSADERMINGEIDFPPMPIERAQVTVPDGFDADYATMEMIRAKENGDIERANFLSAQINQYWKENRDIENDPTLVDPYGGETRQKPINRDYLNDEPSSYAPFWGDDVRIDPRDGFRGGNIVSLSNGHLYAISVQYVNPNYTRLTSRSTDGGMTWSVCNEYVTTNAILYPRLNVADDTLIMSYVMRSTSNQYIAWIRVDVPGATLTNFSSGSPSGSYQDNPISYFYVTNDGPNYNAKYIYAAWVEENTTGTDTTRLRFARSNNIDAATWDIQDTLIFTAGNGVYFKETNIENGDGINLVYCATLHPFNWPTSYDEYIRGYTSTDGGSSWSSVIYITPNDNHLDEDQPSIAGSHNNSNWVCLVRQQDTISSYGHIYNAYSTDNGSNWTLAGWVSIYDDLFLPVVYVDYNSTAFMAAYRMDDTSEEYVRYKQGSITSPNSWNTSVIINDDRTNLSASYGPSVCYDYTTDGVCVAWTNYNSAIYSVWFDKLSWTSGIEEEPVQGDFGPETFAVSAAGGNFRITYSVASAGNVSIDVFDITGRNVANVFEGTREPGTYTLEFTPEFAQGSYFFTISTPQGVKTTRAFLAK
ncbi:exo-alpha-sialidase, partial [candidate division WOR-3 bacterium]|nr:exo-alpha-sialidase [candidate division WOR-3 bacterium]